MSQQRPLTCLECGHASTMGQTHCEACGALVPQAAKAGSASEAPLPGAHASPAVEGATAPSLERPGDVTALPVLDFIGVGFCVLVLAALAVDPDLFRQYANMSVVYLLFAVGYAVLGWDMRTLRCWARIPQIALSAIGLLAFPVGTVINGYIIYRLTRPNVRSAFSSKR
jgi:hypothetical protein